MLVQFLIQFSALNLDQDRAGTIIHSDCFPEALAGWFDAGEPRASHHSSQIFLSICLWTPRNSPKTWKPSTQVYVVQSMSLQSERFLMSLQPCGISPAQGETAVTELLGFCPEKACGPPPSALPVVRARPHADFRPVCTHSRGSRSLPSWT